MKKVLAILLAVVMMAAFVPAFAINAAPAEETVPTVEEAIAGKQKLVPFKSASDDPAQYLDFEIGAQGGFDHGFLDGNVYFDKPNAKTLIRFVDETDVLTYVDGKLAIQALNHSGPTGSGVGGGYQLGIISAQFTKDVESTVTIVFGNTGYYTEFKITPTETCLGMESGTAVIRGSKAEVTVKSASIAAAYTVGQKVNSQIHDDHNDRELTVASISGDTVVFTCEDFAKTTYTILEVGKGTEGAFTVLINENRPGGTIEAPEADKYFRVDYQTKPGKNAGSDMRYIISADLAKVTEGYAEETSVLQNAVVTLAFKKGDGVIKTFSKNLSELPLFEQVVADGEYWTTVDGCALFGFIVRDVPTFAWTSFEFSIVNGEDTLYFAKSNQAALDVIASLGGGVLVGDEQNIHAGNPDEPTKGDRYGNGEGALKAFDNDYSTKAGIGGGEGNNGTVQFTWNYNEAKTIVFYTVYTGNDSKNNGRRPKAWTLYGSNDEGDAKEWAVIDEQTNPNVPNEKVAAMYSAVENPTAYKFYKIVFSTNAGDYFEVEEIQLYEAHTENVPVLNDKIVGATNVKAQNIGTWGTHENEWKLLDGTTGTKLGGNVQGDGKITVTWEYATAQTVTGYGISTANDSYEWGRNPNGWVLYGSEDGVTYNVIHEVNGGIENASYAFSVYGVEAPTAYKYYKIVFDCSGKGAFQMSELTLYN